jgi:hypothetical protein
VTSVTASSLPPLFTTTVGNATTTPGITFTLTNQNPDQLFGVNASGIPYYFTPSGDVIFHGGAFTVTDLHFGLTSLPLSTTTPTSGQYLMYDGTNIVGATTPGGGGGLTGCSTPTSGNLTCDNSVAVTAASVGVMTLGLGSLPQPPAGASGALAANASGVLYWSPGSGAAFTPVTTAPTGAANSLTFGANPTIALATTNPTNGECLLFNGTNITGGPCGTSAVSGPIGGVVAVQ